MLSNALHMLQSFQNSYFIQLFKNQPLCLMRSSSSLTLFSLSVTCSLKFRKPLHGPNSYTLWNKLPSQLRQISDSSYGCHGSYMLQYFIPTGCTKNMAVNVKSVRQFSLVIIHKIFIDHNDQTLFCTKSLQTAACTWFKYKSDLIKIKTKANSTGTQMNYRI